jgi:hypothetical protein
MRSWFIGRFVSWDKRKLRKHQMVPRAGFEPDTSQLQVKLVLTYLN